MDSPIHPTDKSSGLSWTILSNNIDEIIEFSHSDKMENTLWRNEKEITMVTITEDYVSFETSKLLKEKGFNEPCLYYYFSDGIIGRRKGLKDRNCHLVNTFSMPTLQMAMKWLGEIHNMYYEIQLLLGEKAEKYGNLQLGIYQLNSSGTYVWKDWIYADTYVELYEKYIKCCLENLI